MTQSELELAVANATGEALSNVRRRGFQLVLVDSVDAEHETNSRGVHDDASNFGWTPDDFGDEVVSSPRVIDWDRFEEQSEPILISLGHFH